MKLINKVIEKFQHNLGQLDDCTYVECMEEVENLDLLNEFLEKESFSIAESLIVMSIMEYVNEIVRKNLTEKIEYLTELRERF